MEDRQEFISADEERLLGTDQDEYIVATLPASIEQKVIQFLNENTNARAFAEMPETVELPGDGRFLIVEKTGSAYGNHIFTAIIAVQSYAKTLFDASILNEVVKRAMFEFALRDDICRVDLNSDYVFTNTEKKQPRYQAVFEIIHY